MTRREAREQAFMVLFEKTFFEDVSISEIVSDAQEAELIKINAFADVILKAVENNIEVIDSIIAENARKWSIERLPKVSLAVLRLAIGEMKFVDDVPAGVSVNEAVELTKTLVKSIDDIEKGKIEFDYEDFMLHLALVEDDDFTYYGYAPRNAQGDMEFIPERCEVIARQIFGKDIPAETVKSICCDLGMVVLESDDNGVKLEVPAYRVDVQRPCDVVEEILRVYGYNNIEIPMDSHSELFLLITRMQDEAHRFAITYHRSLRGKRNLASVLDDIPGVGEKRKKNLLKHFGSFTKIKEASIEELLEVEGIGQKRYEQIKNEVKVGGAP